MGQIITIINFKGGVGKTTCAVELSAALAKHYGRRTLLVDLDPQASATFYVMTQEHWRHWKDTRGTTYTLFDRQERAIEIHDLIVSDVLGKTTTVFGFDLLPSSPELVDVDLRLADFVGYTLLQHQLDEVRDEYDYIICDCPPNFNPVTKNSLWASDAYIVPTVPDFLSTYGIALLQRSVNKLFALAHTPGQPPLFGPVLGGIILTRIKTNVTLHAHYCQQVRADYPGQVFNHIISDSVRIASAPDNHIPISVMPNSKGHEAELQAQFKALAGEFISRIRHVQTQKKLGMSLA